MTQEEIIAGNKLIAEFMGWEEGDPEGMYDFPDNFPSFLVDEYDCIPPETMLFHSSWDWLVPVVGKCTELLRGNRFILFFADTTNYNSDLYIGFLTNNINSVYKCCLAFINWYNENSTKV